MSVKTVSALESGARRAPYRETISMLSEALGLEPEHRALLASAASRPSQPRLRLVESTTSGAVALDVNLRSQTSVAAAPTRAHPHNLPEELSNLIGREEIVAEVSALVGQHRLVTLVGSGGIGKTRVALRVARNALGDWPDGVWLVELAPVRDEALVASSVSQAFKVRVASNRSPLELLVDSLKNRRVLLVLDNCEHVIDEVSKIVVEILRDCPGVSILATSREPLNITGEWVCRVPPLPTPENTPTSVHEASVYAAVALFADRSQAAAGLELNDRNVAAVSEICRRLDGIPLAIELAAARMKVLTPGQAAQMLDERFRVLTGGDRTAMPRQQTMRSALDWSYSLLSEQERLMFDRLSVFAGGFTLELASAVCTAEGIEDAEVLDLLASLVDKSLVIADRTGERARFRLLESSRDYASEKCNERGEHDPIARRHAQAFLELAERLADFRLRRGPRDHKGFAQARCEQDNWNAALAWSLRDGNDVGLGQRLAEILARPGYLSRDQVLWARMALTTCDKETPRELVAALEFIMAYWCAMNLDLDTALAGWERTIAIYRELGPPERLADAQMHLAFTLARKGRAPEAYELVQQVLERVRRTGNHDELRAHLSRAISVFGSSAPSIDLTYARSLYAEAMNLFQESDGKPADLLAYLHVNMAYCEAMGGEMDAALRLGAAGIAIFRDLEHPNLANTIMTMAETLIASERYDEAQEHAMEALALLCETREGEGGLLVTLHHIAAVAALRGLDDSANLQVDCARSARLLGYAETRLAQMGMFRFVTEYKKREQILTILRKELGENELARLTAAGAAMSEDRAVELARSI